MIESAAKALTQMFSPPFRAVLFKAAGLAILLLAVFAIALHRLMAWLAAEGGAWLGSMVGAGLQTPLHILLWIFALIAGFGLFAGAIFLMPAATSLVASVFADEIAELVEQKHYPARDQAEWKPVSRTQVGYSRLGRYISAYLGYTRDRYHALNQKVRARSDAKPVPTFADRALTDPPGAAVPMARAMTEGVKTSLLALAVYLCAVPFLLFAGFGLIIFFFANSYLLGREYFELAAMRFHPVAQAKALRRAHRVTIFTAGLFIAAFVSIPIVNLATPLFGMAFMVHMHKRIAGGPRRELLEPKT